MPDRVVTPTRPAELPPDMVGAAIEGLREQLRTDRIASWVGGLFLAAVGAAVGAHWTAGLGALVITMAYVRRLGKPALDRGDITRAVVWYTVGSWGVAIGVVAMVPLALPIAVLNLVGPLVTAAIYLDQRSTLRLQWSGAAVAIVLGLLGFRTGGVGIDDAAPDWVFEAVIIGYLAIQVLLTSTLVTVSNRVRLDTLQRALDANDELERASDELRRSRNRLVAAADAERIRIERDIHDGAQQRLVALAVQLKLAAQLARSGTPVDADQIEDLHDQTREAIDELRDLARGIYPSLLAERGLSEALRSVAERARQPVTIDSDGELGLEPSAEAAVYFICSEALQNAAKHAGADAAARVGVHRHRGVVEVEIQDDGRGFDVAAAAASRGLLNMRDRAGAIGGTLAIESRPGGGTTVTARVPVEQPAALAERV